MATYTYVSSCPFTIGRVYTGIRLSPNEYITKIVPSLIGDKYIKVCYHFAADSAIVTFGLSDSLGNKKLNTSQYNYITPRSTTIININPYDVIFTDDNVPEETSSLKGEYLYFNVFGNKTIGSVVTTLNENDITFENNSVTFTITTAVDDGNIIHSGRYNGTSWDKVIPMRYDGTNWVECELQRYNGSSWDTVDTQ